MQLVVFDVDDTLTRSMTADTACFVRIVEEVLGLKDIDTNWSNYRHVTDAGIVAELGERHLKRRLLNGELTEFKERFLALLRREIDRSPIVAIEGAGPLLAALARTGRHDVTLATGAWRDSAMMKLASAGVGVAGLPHATADDHVSRLDILRESIRRANAHYRRPAYRSIVYVGDGLWDAWTCREAGIPLIGIAEGPHAVKLQEAGAWRVFPNFSDPDAFLGALRELDPAHG